ncbi:MAG TPA: hypothetical protein PLL95_04360 [Anaerolineales bacterium]|nr:hypothetical protein [Anaerolineales bacterium]
MIRKIILISTLIFLTSCRVVSSAEIENKIQDKNSTVLPLLITENEIRKISNDFKWESITSEQKMVDLAADEQIPYEMASRMYRGYYQNPDDFITVWHTIVKYEKLIDQSNTEPLKFGVEDNDISDTYFPDITSSGQVSSQCVIYRNMSHICRANTVYTQIESNIYISTLRSYDQEVLSKWLNLIVDTVEERILIEDVK